MCGIAGIVSIGSALVTRDMVKGMTNTLLHRGPDGEGIWVSDDKKIGFGHRRLSIVDLSEGGAQPMHFQDRYTITFNGEIYNYIEVRQSLIDKGHSFKSESDTEVILVAYHEYGPACLTHFDGMFAMVIYDKMSQIVFAARDRFGEKPFYYHHNKEHFYFASEMKALWSQGISKDVNETSMYNYFVSGKSLGSTSGDTFYNEIKQLPSSSSLTLSLQSESIKIEKYWSLDHNVQIEVSDQEAISKVSELLDLSITHRLRADVPVGSSLSGGLDSSLIVGRLGKLGFNKRHTFSATFPGFDRDEGGFQEMMAQSVDTIHHKISPDTSQQMDLIDNLIYHQEEPFLSMSIAVQSEVFKAARASGIVVLLDGQGADEVAAGYNYFSLSHLRGLRKTEGWGSWWNASMEASKNQSLSKAYFVGGSLSPDLPDLIVNNFRKTDPNTAISCLNKDFAHSQAENVEKEIEIYDDLNKALHYHTFTHGLEQLLRYCDRNAMAHSVEVRLPYLHHELVSYLFSLPSHLKIRHGWTKWILRQAAQGTVPNEIIWRKAKVAYESEDNFLVQQMATIQEQMAENLRLKDYFSNETPSQPKLLFRKYLLSRMI